MAERLKNILNFTGLTGGIAVSQAHGLNWHGLALVPDVLQLDVSGFDVTADATNVTVTRISGPDAVDVLCESWHTVERAFGSVAPVITNGLTPRPIVIVGSGTGGGSDGFREISGTDYATGAAIPTDSDLVVYVQSPVDVALPQLQPSLGNDNNDGLTKLTPLESLDGVRRMIGRRGIEGKRIIIKLAGGSATQVYPNIDPWDGFPTQVRYYQVRGVFLGGSEAFRNTWCIEGPYNMFTSQSFAVGTISISNVGLRTKWTAVDPVVAIARPSWMRVIRPFVAWAPLTAYATGNTRTNAGRVYTCITAGISAASGGPTTTSLDITDGTVHWQYMGEVGNQAGYEAAFPSQVTQFGANEWYTDNGPNAPFGGVYLSTDQYTLVRAAAEIVGNGPGASLDGVRILGEGAYKLGDITGNPVPGDDINQRYAFRRVTFERLRAEAGDFENCGVYGTAEFRGYWPRFVGMSIVSGACKFIDCGDRQLGPGSSLNDYFGFASVLSALGGAGPFPNGGNPLWPTRGGAELAVISSQFYMRNSTYTFYKGGLSVSFDAAANGAVLLDKASYLEQGDEDNGTASAIFYIRNPSGIGIWSRQGSECRINDSEGVAEIITAAPGAAAGPLRVGRGAGIALGAGVGAFLEVIGYNGNFTRHLEVSGTGFPTGDFSRIFDKGWQ